MSTKKLQILGSLGTDIELDSTLLESGKAADAKAVGDALAQKQPVGNYATETYVNNAIGAIPTPDVSGQINTHNSSTSAHSDIRTSINNLSTLVGDTAVAQQISTAIADKANTSDLTSHTGNKSNPHGVTVSQIGAAPSTHTHSKSQITDFPTTETWTFTLEDGSTVTKAVYVG